MQKGQKLQRARWPVPFRPFTLINKKKKKLTGTAGGGGGGAGAPPPLESATEVKPETSVDLEVGLRGLLTP